jgi:murein L,D-transpeptidase YafK
MTKTLLSIFKIILGILITLVILAAAYYYYPEPHLPKDAQVDSIVVFKSKHQLLAYSNGKLLKTYTISIGRNPIGKKEFEDDKKTPEGIYFIKDKNPNSGYCKNLGISYPNSEDIKNAKKLGKPTGGDVKIHGLKNGDWYTRKFHRWKDWTNGCIALTDDEVEELYNAVPIGTRIKINP